MARKIERAIASLSRRRARANKPRAGTQDHTTFRATVDERLRNLEKQLDEVKGRVNGLLFLLAGAVATQVVLRLFA
jgi:hypothetical protein